MTENIQLPNWGEQPVTRRDIMRFALGASAIIASQPVAETVSKIVIDDRVRGPRWPSEWVRLPQPEAAKIPWRTFKGNKGLMGRLRLTDQAYDAAIITVPRDNLDAQCEGLPPTATPAAIWYPGGNEIELTPLAWDVISPVALPYDYAIGMGVREGDLSATMGLYVPETRSVIIGEGVTDAGMVRTYNMPEKFPGAVWV